MDSISILLYIFIAVFIISSVLFLNWLNYTSKNVFLKTIILVPFYTYMIGDFIIEIVFNFVNEQFLMGIFNLFLLIVVIIPSYILFLLDFSIVVNFLNKVLPPKVMSIVREIIKIVNEDDKPMEKEQKNNFKKYILLSGFDSMGILKKSILKFAGMLFVVITSSYLFKLFDIDWFTALIACLIITIADGIRDVLYQKNKKEKNAEKKLFSDKSDA
ncbi:hypothetical protein [Marininema halotolerans]|uniref:Uncharacterized protein n=1 Tax=Marininema halotolerans TaxID=1155944 RepID=A0A1I6RH38_9BACL|nr:hypothetical protein [Marininema halotolerans]SFS64039.1 hypothetical protein SAMN05444972_10589 [Marininema halotolerans]